MVDFIVNTPTKGNDAKRDGFRIRRAAVESSLDVFTALDTVNAMADVLKYNIHTYDVDVYDQAKNK